MLLINSQDISPISPSSFGTMPSSFQHLKCRSNRAEALKGVLWIQKMQWIGESVRLFLTISNRLVPGRQVYKAYRSVHFNACHWQPARQSTRYSVSMDYVQRTLSEIAHLDLKDWITDTQLHAASFGASCDVYSAWSRKHGEKSCREENSRLLDKGKCIFEGEVWWTSFPERISDKFLVAPRKRDPYMGEAWSRERPAASRLYHGRRTHGAESNIRVDG